METKSKSFVGLPRETELFVGLPRFAPFEKYVGEAFNLLSGNHELVRDYGGESGLIMCLLRGKSPIDWHVSIREMLIEINSEWQNVFADAKMIADAYESSRMHAPPVDEKPCSIPVDSVSTGSKAAENSVKEPVERVRCSIDDWLMHHINRQLQAAETTRRRIRDTKNMQ
jgi:hypothetical protein